MKKICLALENIRSLYNIGAIYRTAEFFGIDKIYLLGYSGINPNEKDLLHKKLQKTSLGTISKLETEHFNSIIDLHNKYPSTVLYAIENNVKKTVFLNDWKPTEEELILVFGNEVTGLSSEALNLAKQIVEIKRHGQHDSLNVEATAAIVIYYAKQL